MFHMPVCLCSHPVCASAMTFVRIYLVGYFLLISGAVFVLWQAGVLAELPRRWIAIGLSTAIGFGVLLALASGPRAVTQTRQ